MRQYADIIWLGMCGGGGELASFNNDSLTVGGDQQNTTLI